MKKIYLDTNIYIDYFDGRSNGLRPLGDFAYELLRRTFQCEFVIIISPLVLDELFYNTYEKKINRLMKDLKEESKVISITETETDRMEARMLAKQRKTDFNDTLHTVLASRVKADFLVTRNIQHFAQLHDLINVCYPENL